MKDGGHVHTGKDPKGKHAHKMYALKGKLKVIEHPKIIIEGIKKGKTIYGRITRVVKTKARRKKTRKFKR